MVEHFLVNFVKSTQGCNQNDNMRLNQNSEIIKIYSDAYSDILI